MSAPDPHLTTKTRFRRYRILSVAAAVAAATIALAGKPRVDPVLVTLPADKGVAPRVERLPFGGEASDDVAGFTVDATVLITPLSSTTLRILPDECVEEYTVNGGEPQDLRKKDELSRCWPNAYELTWADGLRPGANTLRLSLMNKYGPYGIDIVGSLNTAVALAVGILSWVSLAAGLAPIVDRPMPGRQVGALVRACRRFGMVSFGAVLIAAIRVNAYGGLSPLDEPFVGLAAVTVAAMLLMAVLDGKRSKPLPHRRSAGWAAICVLALTLAALKSVTPYEPVARTALACLGVLAGVVASTPFFAMLHRVRTAPKAAALAAAIAGMPLAYSTLQLEWWALMVGPTTAATAAIVSIFGWKVSTSYGTRLWDDGSVRDYHGYVATPEFSVQIGSWCGGFEGVTLFLFLLAAFILFDWREFCGARRLWLPFVATIPYLFVVNVLRIAGILLYALSVVGAKGADAASNAAVETFHSHVGWVIYSLAFGPYLWAVYRSVARHR